MLLRFPIVDVCAFFQLMRNQVREYALSKRTDIFKPISSAERFISGHPPGTLSDSIHFFSSISAGFGTLYVLIFPLSSRLVPLRPAVPRKKTHGYRSAILAAASFLIILLNMAPSLTISISDPIFRFPIRRYSLDFSPFALS